jgi:hypothetical protein
MAISLLLYGLGMNAHKLHMILGISYKTTTRMVRTINAAFGETRPSSFEDAVRRCAELLAVRTRAI